MIKNKYYLIICFLFAALCLSESCNKTAQEVKIEINPDPGIDLYGAVLDNSGKPLEGVVVSDGYSCTATDSKGIYQLKRSKYATQVNVSIPASCKVPVDKGIPHFWQELSVKKRYDFTLEALSGGSEKDFFLVAMADPQCQDDKHIARFSSETVPDIKSTASELNGKPVYGITLGDIGWNTTNNDHNLKKSIFTKMRAAMSQEKTGIAFFQVMGNHDNSHASVLPKASYTVAGDIQNQRDFEIVFGPVNYSFNRGDVHVLGMDDIIFPNHSEYSMGFRDDQIEWLKQDLSYVPKDKMVILCVHIPFERNTNGKNVEKVLSLLAPYKNVQILSGHTHYARNIAAPSYYEHTQGAACGAWWHSTVNVDGTPNGYAVYSISQTNLSNWYYKGTGLVKEEQIRAYKGGIKYGYNAYFTRFLDDAPNKIFANVWNSDSSWKVEVFRNGTKLGDMKLQDPARNVLDAWACGYHIGRLGCGMHYERKKLTHIFEYTLSDTSLTGLEIRATDRFGKTYTQTVFTDNTENFFPKIPQI